MLVRGLNALAATVSAPVIAGARLRGGNAGSARSAADFAAWAVATARLPRRMRPKRRETPCRPRPGTLPALECQPEDFRAWAQPRRQPG